MRTVATTGAIVTLSAQILTAQTQTQAWIEQVGSEGKIVQTTRQPVREPSIPGAGGWVRIDDFSASKHYQEFRSSLHSWRVTRDTAGVCTQEEHSNWSGTLVVEHLDTMNRIDYPHRFAGTAAQQNPPAFAEAIRLLGTVEAETAQTEIVSFKGANETYRFRLTFDELGRPTTINDMLKRADGSLTKGIHEFTWSYNDPADVLPSVIGSLILVELEPAGVSQGKVEYEATYTFHTQWPQTR